MDLRLRQRLQGRCGLRLRLRLLERLESKPLPPHLQQRVHQGSRERIDPVLLSGNPCNSFDNIHIDNNTFLDPYRQWPGSGHVLQLQRQPTVSNSEIKNNVFYNNRGGSLFIAPSSAFTAADWNVDYNNISGGSRPISVGGSTYTQTHPSTCTPAFTGYRPDTTPLSQNYAQWGGTDLSLAAGDSCLANNGTSLSSLFTTDKNRTPRPQGGVWDIGAYEKYNRLERSASQGRTGERSCFWRQIRERQAAFVRQSR